MYIMQIVHLVVSFEADVSFCECKININYFGRISILIHVAISNYSYVRVCFESKRVFISLLLEGTYYFLDILPFKISTSGRKLYTRMKKKTASQ